MMYTINMTDEEIRREIRRQRKRKLLKRRIISLAVAVAIAAGGGFLVGNAIGNNRYEKEIKGIVPVAADKPIVKVAMSQLGNKGGEPFWSWFGFDERVDWCACFVSWCEN